MKYLKLAAGVAWVSVPLVVFSLLVWTGADKEETPFRITWNHGKVKVSSSKSVQVVCGKDNGNIRLGSLEGGEEIVTGPVRWCYADQTSFIYRRASREPGTSGPLTVNVNTVISKIPLETLACFVKDFQLGIVRESPTMFTVGENMGQFITHCSSPARMIAFK